MEGSPWVALGWWGSITEVPKQGTQSSPWPWALVLHTLISYHTKVCLQRSWNIHVLWKCRQEGRLEMEKHKQTEKKKNHEFKQWEAIVPPAETVNRWVVSKEYPVTDPGISESSEKTGGGRQEHKTYHMNREKLNESFPSCLLDYHCSSEHQNHTILCVWGKINLIASRKWGGRSTPNPHLSSICFKPSAETQWDKPWKESGTRDDGTREKIRCRLEDSHWESIPEGIWRINI